jgi:pantoate--beta-alanine ligase
LQGEDGVRADYLAVVDADDLLPVERVEVGTLVAVAAYVGKTRLIDNFVVTIS